MSRVPAPFPVDDAVLARIRPMQFRDAEDMARLHHAAMGDSLWARLGAHFLAVLYRVLIDTPGFLAFVYEEDGRVRGFIAGSTDTATMMRTALRRGWFLIGPAALPGALRSPGTALRLLDTPRYTAASSAVSLPAGLTAESLFCSFEPDLRGKRVSGHINKVLFDELRARGHQHVKITTDAGNAAAVRQLESWGFAEAGTFAFYGKPMRTFVLDLVASPRVEPRSRHPMVE